MLFCDVERTFKCRNDTCRDLSRRCVFLVSDDARIMTFLRGCKFSREKCKRKLDMYFTMRAAIPEFFANRDPFGADVQEVMKLA